MMAVKWSVENLIAQDSGPQAAIAGMVVAAERGEKVRVQIERSESHQILGRSDCVAASKARFREGCIKAVESRIWPLPQRGRVLAEIHRRFDQVLEPNCNSATWRSGFASIYDYAGAWALASRLMLVGLRVSVVEGEPANEPSGRDGKRADVEIVIPIGPTKGD